MSLTMQGKYIDVQSRIGLIETMLDEIIALQDKFTCYQLMQRVELNLERAIDDSYVEKTRISHEFGMECSPSICWRAGLLKSLTKCIAHVTNDMLILSIDPLSTAFLGDYLDNLRDCMHTDGLLANQNKDMEILGAVSDLLADLLWLPCGIIMPPYSEDIVLIRPVKVDDGNASSYNNCLYKYRWFEMPYCEKLQMFSFALNNDALSANHPVASEIYPLGMRVGYCGEWMLGSNEIVQTGFDQYEGSIDVQYHGLNVHNCHPLVLHQQLHDLSIVDFSSDKSPPKFAVASCRGATTEACAHSIAKHVYTMCSQVRMWIAKLETKHMVGIYAIINEVGELDSELQRVLKSCWFSLFPPNSLPNYSVDIPTLQILFRNRLDALCHEFAQVDQPINPPAYNMKLFHSSTDGICKNLSHSSIRDLPNIIWKYLQKISNGICSVLNSTICLLMMRKSTFLTECYFVKDMEIVILETLSALNSSTSSFFAPKISNRMTKLTEELQQGLYNRSIINPMTLTLKDFSKLTTFQIKKLPQSFFKSISVTYSTKDVSDCIKRCMSLNIDLGNLGLNVKGVSTDPERYLHTLTQNTLYDKIIPISYPPGQTLGYLFACLHIVTSFMYTPTITPGHLNSLHNILCKKYVRLAFLTYMLVWVNPKAWDYLSKTFAMYQTMADMNTTEYMLYIIEELDPDFSDLPIDYRARLPHRRFLSVSKDGLAIIQPQIYYVTEDGHWTSYPPGSNLQGQSTTKVHSTSRNMDTVETVENADDLSEVMDVDPYTHVSRPRLSASNSSDSISHLRDDVFQFTTYEALDKCVLNAIVWDLLYGNRSKQITRLAELRSLLNIQPGEYSAILSKIILRICSEKRTVCNEMLADTLIYNAATTYLDESTMHCCWSACWTNLYRSVNISPRLFYDNYMLLCDAMGKPPSSVQLGRMHGLVQLVIFTQWFTLGCVSDIYSCTCAVQSEITHCGYSGILFRYMDFLRCYVKPMTPEAYEMSCKGLRSILKVRVDLTFPHVVAVKSLAEDDINRNILHHSVDMGFQPDFTIDILDILIDHIVDEPDDFGRTFATLRASVLHQVDVCYNLRYRCAT